MNFTAPGAFLSESLYANAYALHEEQPTRALPLFQLLAKIVPTDERGWLGIGLCHERLEMLDLALSIYTFGQGAARSARCLVARARTLVKLGREDDAEDVLDHALGLDFWTDEEESLLTAARGDLS